MTAQLVAILDTVSAFLPTPLVFYAGVITQVHPLAYLLIAFITWLLYWAVRGEDEPYDFHRRATSALMSALTWPISLPFLVVLKVARYARRWGKRFSEWLSLLHARKVLRAKGEVE
jgi:hypothetical protein